jgi:hypothetical protein
MKRKLARPGIAALVGVAAVLVGAGIAMATIPDANGTVHGCVKKNKGGVYVIDPSAGQSCAKDIALDWNRTGATGQPGSAGPQGFDGFQGSAGSSGYERQRDQEATDGSGNGSAEADCPSGKVALAGGYELTYGVVPLRSAPTSDGSGWVVHVTGTASSTFAAYAICATNGGS